MTPAMVIPNSAHYVRVLKVKDGDALVVSYDVGNIVTAHPTIRLLRCNAPELKTPEGLISKAWVENQLMPISIANGDKPVFIIVYKGIDVRDRWLCEFWYPDPALNVPWLNLSDELMKTGMAKPYP